MLSESICALGASAFSTVETSSSSPMGSVSFSSSAPPLPLGLQIQVDGAAHSAWPSLEPDGLCILMPHIYICPSNVVGVVWVILQSCSDNARYINIFCNPCFSFVC